jgi:hypothetical protein
MRSAMWIPLAVGALLACGGGTTVDDNNFRQDVFYCEEALGVLSSCCPSFAALGIPCQYSYSFAPSNTGGCGAGTTTEVDPALSLPESECILSTPCDELVANGVCARAQTASAYSNKDTSTGSNFENGPQTTSKSSSNHGPVCP